MKKHRVWETRWMRLKEAGFTLEQAHEVYALVDEIRGFHSETIAESARKDLALVYGKEN